MLLRPVVPYTPTITVELLAGGVSGSGTLKGVVNTVGGLLASRRVFCWLPLIFFCFYSTNSD